MLGDPSHLTADEVQELLDHWYSRQEGGSRVLHFHQVLKSGELQGSADRVVGRQTARRGKEKKKPGSNDQLEDSPDPQTGPRRAERSGKGKKKARFHDTDPLEDDALPIFSKVVYKTPLPGNRPRPGRSSRNFLADPAKALNNGCLPSSLPPGEQAPDYVGLPEAEWLTVPGQSSLLGHSKPPEVVMLPEPTQQPELPIQLALEIVEQNPIRPLGSPEPAMTPEFTQELQAIADKHTVHYWKKVFVELHNCLFQHLIHFNNYFSIAPRPIPRPIVKGSYNTNSEKTIHLESAGAGNLRSSKEVRKSPRFQKL